MNIRCQSFYQSIKANLPTVSTEYIPCAGITVSTDNPKLNLEIQEWTAIRKMKSNYGVMWNNADQEDLLEKLLPEISTEK